MAGRSNPEAFRSQPLGLVLGLVDYAEQTGEFERLGKLGNLRRLHVMWGQAMERLRTGWRVLCSPLSPRWLFL